VTSRALVFSFLSLRLSSPDSGHSLVFLSSKQPTNILFAFHLDTGCQKTHKILLRCHFKSERDHTTEPVFADLLGRPGIDFQPGEPVRKSYFSHRPVRLHRLAKSIPRNRFLGSINVYKHGLCIQSTEFLSSRLNWVSHPLPRKRVCLPPQDPNGGWETQSLGGGGGEIQFRRLNKISGTLYRIISLRFKCKKTID
jgi:hypothetical protein